MQIRYHYLDFLRALAMLLGLAVHAPLIYIFPYVAQDMGLVGVPEPEFWVYVVLGFITSWRMQLFFLLSGFFSMLLIQKQGLKNFLVNRIIRIGLTFILFAMLFDFFDGKFDGTLEHLWFLYYLLIFIFIISILCWFPFVKKVLSKNLASNLVLIIGCWLTFSWLLGTIINGENIEAPHTYANTQIGSLIYYFSYFIVGVMLYQNHYLFDKFAQNRVILFLTPMALMTFTLQDVFSLHWILSLTLDGLNSLLWSILLIGLASKLIKSSSTLLSWLVEISYPVYLLHVSVIVIISSALFEFGFNQFNAFCISIITGFTACVVLYYLLIKFTPLSWLINGYSKSLFKLKFTYRG